MTTVTAPGSAAGAPTISFTFDPGAGLQTAQQIANDLSGAVTAGTLTVTTVSGSGAVPAPGGGGVQELLVEGPLASTVPAGYNYVVNNASAAITISAASNTAATFRRMTDGWQHWSTNCCVPCSGVRSGEVEFTATGKRQ